MWASLRRHVADHSSDVRVAMPSHLHSTKSALLADYSKLAPAMVPRPLWIPDLYLQIERKKRADERTRTADLLITSDNSRVAGVCRSLQIPHFQRVLFSLHCLVLHRIAFP